MTSSISAYVVRVLLHFGQGWFLWPLFNDILTGKISPQVLHIKGMVIISSDLIFISFHVFVLMPTTYGADDDVVNKNEVVVGVVQTGAA